MMKTGFGHIHINDFFKGLFLIAIISVLQSIYPIINQHRLPNATELANTGFDAINVMIAYLLKNLVTNNKGNLLKKDE